MSKNALFLIFLLLILGGFLVLREIGNRTTSHSSTTPTSLATSESASADNPSNNNEPQNFSKWREYTSTYHHFKVTMPTLPQHATDKVLDPKTGEARRYDTFVAADTNGQAYMITVITYPKPIPKNEQDQLLQDAVGDIVSRKKENKLVSVEADNFKAFNAVKFTVTNGQLYMTGEALISGSSLFIISILTKSPNKDSEEVKFFVNSFDTVLDEQLSKTKENK